MSYWRKWGHLHSGSLPSVDRLTDHAWNDLHSVGHKAINQSWQSSSWHPPSKSCTLLAVAGTCKSCSIHLVCTVILQECIDSINWPDLFLSFLKLVISLYHVFCFMSSTLKSCACSSCMMTFFKQKSKTLTY